MWKLVRRIVDRGRDIKLFLSFIGGLLRFFCITRALLPWGFPVLERRTADMVEG